MRIIAAHYQRFRIVETIASYFALVGICTSIIAQEAYMGRDKEALSSQQEGFGLLLTYVDFLFTLCAAFAIYIRYMMLL